MKRMLAVLSLASWRLFLMEVEETVVNSETELHELMSELSAPPAASPGQ